MQFHPLFWDGILPPIRFWNLSNAIGLQHQIVVFKLAQIGPSLNLEALALFHLFDDRLGLFRLHIFGNPDGAGEVGDVEAHRPGLPPGKLPVLHIEYLALHQYPAHVQCELTEGSRLFLGGDSSVNYLFALLFSAAASRGRGSLSHQLPAHRLHLRFQVLGRLFPRVLGLCRGLSLFYPWFRLGPFCWPRYGFSLVMVLFLLRFFRFTGLRLVHRHRGRVEPKRLLQSIRRLGQDILRHHGAVGNHLHGPLGLEHPHPNRIAP